MHHHRTPLRAAWLGALSLALAAGCKDADRTPVPPAPVGVRPAPGGPLPGLTAAELAAFVRGQAVFERRFKPSEGLGPFYNATSCSSCHSTPTTGGSSQLYRNFYVAMKGFLGQQVPLNSLPSLVIPAFGAGTTFELEGGRIVLPPSKSPPKAVVAQRNAIPIFGVALFEKIRNSTIRANADPDDADGDGISGRFNTFGSGMGRFGVKAQANNIESFTRGPLNNQMGITTNPVDGSSGVVSLHYRTMQAPGLEDDPTLDNDGVPDPELVTADLADLIAFQRFLAPPAKKLPFSAAAERGELLFAAAGCVDCHIPALASTVGPVEAFTDLLLHDMGPGLADGLSLGAAQAAVGQPSTTEKEFRTQPLWGVSLHAPFLHDGRAETLAEAVTLHGGEATTSRDAFLALSLAERADLIEYLEHL